MKLHPISNSSQIKACGYDKDADTMRVQFFSGGVYEYANVDSELYHKVINSESIGKAFATIIKANKDKYPFTKIA